MPDDALNPFHYLGGAAAKVIADSWTLAMLGLWNAGLWAFRLVLRIVDAMTTPDLRADGPGADLYRVTFWMAGALVLVLVLVQLGVAALRRDAKSLATVLLGLGKFVVVWAGWMSYGVAVVAACGGLTRALMNTLLRVSSWSAWQPWTAFTLDDTVDGSVATVLGLMGLLLWLAAIGHLLVMLTRGGALMVLVATAPISAAGLVGEAGRSWFWKSLRWFHAAAFTPVLMVLVLGVGQQMTTGVGTGLAGTPQAGIGTALPGVVMILISCFAPLALFKLLAFVEPGTSSGSALRQGLAAQGGLQGLLAGPNAGADQGSSAATSVDRAGRSQGESAGEDSTTARFDQAQTGLLKQLAGGLGGAAAQGLGLMQKVGATGAAVGADLTNQMGVGHTNYHPDFFPTNGGTRTSAGEDRDTSGNPDSGGGGPSTADAGPFRGDAEPPSSLPAAPSSTSSPASPLPGGGSPVSPTAGGPRGAAGPGNSGGKATSTGATGGTAEAAAAVPIVPV